MEIRRGLRRSTVLASAACAVAVTAAAIPNALATGGRPGARHGTPRASSTRQWVSSWSASPQQATPGSPAAAGFADQTVRNIVFTSAGGELVRVRFTNAYGADSLRIGAASLALAGTGAGSSGPSHPLTFGGARSLTIPPGAEALSDPVAMDVPALRDLAISVYLPSRTGPATNHSDARQTNYIAAGNHADDTAPTAFSTTSGSWYFVDSVDVTSARDRGTIVALGDSITDGANSTVNANARWVNDLARRLDEHPGSAFGVADEGIDGNRILHDSPCFGVNALARFDRDVLARAGVRDVILLEGINDIGFSQLRPGPGSTVVGPHGGFGVPISCFQPNPEVTAADIIAGDEQLIAQAHEAGLKIFGATLTPFKDAPYWTPGAEARREAVNHWITTSGAFDGVIDFARAVAAPGDPTSVNPAYDSGDHLHPNDKGYRAMANAIDLALVTG